VRAGGKREEGGEVRMGWFCCEVLEGDAVAVQALGSIGSRTATTRLPTPTSLGAPPHRFPLAVLYDETRS
jgi:hypothetical protein